jgi:hypothetical protein
MKKVIQPHEGTIQRKEVTTKTLIVKRNSCRGGQKEQLTSQFLVY